MGSSPVSGYARKYEKRAGGSVNLLCFGKFKAIAESLSLANDKTRGNADRLDISLDTNIPLQRWAPSVRSRWIRNGDNRLRQQHGQNAMQVMTRIQAENGRGWFRHRNGVIGWFVSYERDGKRNLRAERKESSHFIIPLIVAIFLLTSPSVMLVNGAINISDNIANAQPLGQIRQAAVFLERFAGGTASGKILDKVMTVISGQTVVTPETIEGIKSIIDGEDSDHLKIDIENNVGNFWSTTLDVISNFNPQLLMDSTGTSIQGLFEVGAERFAAFELSTLVALGERWLLWTPFVLLPMYLQMSRSWNKDQDGNTDKKEVAVELSEETEAKAVRVRKELERMELKADLLDLVYSLGKMAFQSSMVDQDVKRRQIDEMMNRLKELNPMDNLFSRDPANTVAGTEQSISFSFIHPVSDVDGDWNLIYVSQATDQNQQQQVPQFPNLDLPGVELSNMRQKIWLNGSRGSLPTIQEDAGDQMMARNTAEIRLGPLGVMEISVQGSWENLRSGKNALVSFDTFSVRPIEVLGTPVREDAPPLNVSIPRSLQISGDWEIVYLDDSIRINKGRMGKLYLFRKTL